MKNAFKKAALYGAAPAAIGIGTYLFSSYVLHSPTPPSETLALVMTLGMIGMAKPGIFDIQSFGKRAATGAGAAVAATTAATGTLSLSVLGLTGSFAQAAQVFQNPTPGSLVAIGLASIVGFNVVKGAVCLGKKWDKAAPTKP
jgi:hypothetical protein